MAAAEARAAESAERVGAAGWVEGRLVPVCMAGIKLEQLLEVGKEETQIFQIDRV